MIWESTPSEEDNKIKYTIKEFLNLWRSSLSSDECYFYLKNTESNPIESSDIDPKESSDMLEKFLTNDTNYVDSHEIKILKFIEPDYNRKHDRFSYLNKNLKLKHKRRNHLTHSRKTFNKFNSTN